jgi:hypothetical protein
MKAFLLLLIVLPAAATSGMQISPRIEAPFTAEPQSRSNVDSSGNVTRIFMQMMPIKDRRMIIYLVAETDISLKNQSWNPLLGWKERVMEAKNSMDSGVSYEDAQIISSSGSTHELKYLVKMTKSTMKKHFANGFGFASGKSMSDGAFIQIGTECLGYSEPECQRFYENFRNSVKIRS